MSLISIIHRLVTAALIILLASSAIFFALRLLPGDPVMMLLGDTGATSPEVVAEMRRSLGFDQPLAIQYVRWLYDLLTLNMGQSISMGVPVTQVVATAIPRSLELIGAGVLVAIVIGIPLGIMGGRPGRRLADFLSSSFAVLGISAPIFVLGLVLILVFSLHLQWLPPSGYVTIARNPISHFQLLILPALTIGLSFSGLVIRMTRASMLDTLSKDYIKTAVAKGAGPGRVLYRHALPNALVPVVAIVGVRIGSLLGGTVLVESLFNWPGLSSLLVRACVSRDYPLIQGTLIAIFAIYILISICVDLIQDYLHPQSRDA